MVEEKKDFKSPIGEPGSTDRLTSDDDSWPSNKGRRLTVEVYETRIKPELLSLGLDTCIFDWWPTNEKGEYLTWDEVFGDLT